MEQIFDSLADASRYLQDNYNGHGTVVGADTGLVLKQCRCRKSPNHPVVYANDANGYASVRVNPWRDDVLGKSNVTVLTPNDELKGVRNGIFLAGPASRCEKPIGWREAFINLFRLHNAPCTILNPEVAGYGEFDNERYRRQTEWESNAMHLATRIIFWIPRTDEHPALTTNVEFGEWNYADGIYVGFPLNSQHNRYIATKCEDAGRGTYNCIPEIVRDVVDDLGQKPRTFFTSDTHFGAERTLELSRRPFRDVRHMDMALASNWNKTVRDCDTVYHLGDFGDWSMLDNLNGTRIVLVKGNYDRNEGVPDDARLEVHDEPMRVKMSRNGQTYTLVHEPCCDEPSDGMFLYGHIHQAQLVKANGINVGVDCNNYKPVDISTIEFRTNGIRKHYDENVFCQRAGNGRME